MNATGAKRITSESPTSEREVTPHITPGLLLGTLNMEITGLIDPGSVVANLRVTCKKQALQELAKRATAIPPDVLAKIFAPGSFAPRLPLPGPPPPQAFPYQHSSQEAPVL